ncbi:MAG: NAD(P)/FAD-dependent oxidoreductase [Deltaproteobacteria bacterium]|nr:NAD(P)/FAD-dependent oxidoreductase [Deltaproteobacteria bacterium]
MTANRFDVIVIGAGPGGAPCAALLAKRGFKTLLIEQNDRAGGKAMTVSKKGFRYELWPVTGGPMYNSRFEELLTELGLETGLTTHDIHMAFYYPDDGGAYRPFFTNRPLPGQGPDPEVMMAQMRWLGIDDAGLGEITRMAMETAALSPYEIDQLDDITYYDYLIRKYNLPKSFYSFLGMQANIVFVLPIDLVAASEFIRTSRDMMANAAGYYSKGGYGRLFERCAKAFEKLGGKVRYRSRAEKILVEHGRVGGVITNKGTFHAPIVVSNAGIQPTVLKLVGQEHFDKGYVNRVRDLVPSLGLMGTRYFLNTPFFKEGANFAFSDESYWNQERSLRAKAGEVPEEMLVFNVIPSNFDPDLAPEGKQCVLASTLCPADPEMRNNKAYWDRLDRMMERVWPGFTATVEAKERYSTRNVSALVRDQVLPKIGGECIGLGQVVGQCGRYKPSPAAPISGLFYVGCDAGGYGCGTHQGVDSAFNVARLVELYHQTH